MPPTARDFRTSADGQVRVEQVRVDGLEMRAWTFAGGDAERAASTDARDVVLVHGLGTSAATFRRLVPHLLPAASVHMLELPGFARLPRPDGSLPIADLARLVTSWLERAGIERPVLLGHSMGTQVVAEAAVGTPALASGLVLVGPTVDVTARTAPGQLVRLVRSAVHEPPRSGAVVLRGYLECGPRWYLAELRHMLEHPLEDRLPLVDAPVLVVRGEHDRVAPAPWVEQLARLAPHGRAVTVPGAAHAAMHSHAHAVADLVRAHLER